MLLQILNMGVCVFRMFVCFGCVDFSYNGNARAGTMTATKGMATVIARTVTACERIETDALQMPTACDAMATTDGIMPTDGERTNTITRRTGLTVGFSMADSERAKTVDHIDLTGSVVNKFDLYL